MGVNQLHNRSEKSNVILGASTDHEQGTGVASG